MKFVNATNEPHSAVGKLGKHDCTVVYCPMITTMFTQTERMQKALSLTGALQCTVCVEETIPRDSSVPPHNPSLSFCLSSCCLLLSFFLPSLDTLNPNFTQNVTSRGGMK